MMLYLPQSEPGMWAGAAMTVDAAATRSHLSESMVLGGVQRSEMSRSDKQLHDGLR